MWALIFLFVCSLVDIRWRALPVWLLSCGTISAIVYRVFQWNDQPAVWMGGALIGCLFLGISKWTKEGLGYGDSWLIVTLGLYLGFWEILWLLCIAFFVAGFVALCYLVKRNYSRTAGIPFVPCLLIGYLGVMYL